MSYSARAEHVAMRKRIERKLIDMKRHEKYSPFA